MLANLFKQMLTLLGKGLALNLTLISANQREYQNDMELKFEKMKRTMHTYLPELAREEQDPLGALHSMAPLSPSQLVEDDEEIIHFLSEHL